MLTKPWYMQIRKFVRLDTAKTNVIYWFIVFTKNGGESQAKSPIFLWTVL